MGETKRTMKKGRQKKEDKERTTIEHLLSKEKKSATQTSVLQPGCGHIYQTLKGRVLLIPQHNLYPDFIAITSKHM